MSAPSWPDAAPLRAIHFQAEEAAETARRAVLTSAGWVELTDELQRAQMTAALDRLTESAMLALQQAAQCATNLGLLRRADLLTSASAIASAAAIMDENAPRRGLNDHADRLRAELDDAYAELRQAREVLFILAGLASCGGEVAARLMGADFNLEGLTDGQVDALTSQAIRVRRLPDADIAAALRFALGGR